MDRLAASLLFLAFSGIYFSTGLEVHTELDDAMNYGAYLSDDSFKTLFHGSHLIYLWLINQLHTIVLRITSTIDVYHLAQYCNHLIASANVAVFFLLARAVGSDRIVGILFSITLGVSYHFWLFAVDIEVLQATLLFFLLSLYIAVHIRPTSSWPIYAFTGALSGLAILFHLLAGLIGILTILIMLKRSVCSASLQKKAFPPLRNVLIYFFTTALITTIPYLFVVREILHHQTVFETIGWIAEFSNSGFETTKSWRHAFMEAPQGIGRAFLGTLTWFATPILGDLLQSALADKCLAQELFSIRNISVYGAILSFICGVLAILSILSATVYSIIYLSGKKELSSPYLAVLICWIVMYGLFILWFGARIPEQWATFWLPGFFLLLAVCLSKIKDKAGFKPVLLSGLLSASLFATNTLNISVQLDAENDYYRNRLNWYEQHTNQSDIILFSGDYEITGYATYYLKAQTVPVGEILPRYQEKTDNLTVSLDRLWERRQTASDHSGRIFLLVDLFSEKDAAVCTQDIAYQNYASLFAEHSLEVTCDTLVDNTVCKLERYPLDKWFSPAHQ